MTESVRRLGPRSLTARLVMGVCGLVLVLVGLIGTATYFAQRSFLYDRLDQQLSPIAEANARFVSACVMPTCSLGPPPGTGYRAPETEWVVVLRPDGTAFATVDDNSNGGSLRALALTDGVTGSVLSGDRSPHTVGTADGQSLRIAAVPIDGGRLYVVTGLSVNQVNTTLRRLVVIEIVIGLGALAIAFVVTSLGVRFTLRGLRRVTTTAQEVAAELSPEGAGLERRVPVMDESTEVGQLADSMNTLLGAVETQFAARLESEQRMRQFLADASHELRTPLTSIRGFAELARMQRAGTATADDNLDRIESEGTRMSRLVEDLLVLARGDAAARPDRYEFVDVAQLVDDAASSARAAYPERVIETAVTAAPEVLGDRDQLLRVVRNLVTNAAVHTSAGRPIRLNAEPGGLGVVIRVIDGGPGLPPEDAAHVFERFWRADKARTRARGGSGLGLSIVDSVVRAHGGSVRFESSVEHGSTVTVTLPAAPPGGEYAP